MSLNDDSDKISGGGGSIIYYKDYISVSVCECFDKAPDSTAILVDTSAGNICLACVYRSPSLSNIQNDELKRSILSVCQEDIKFETVIFGDFNLPNVSWETGSIRGSVNSNNQILNNEKQYIDIFNSKGLTWYLTNETTRRRLVGGSLQESLLDQVLSTNDSLVSDVQLLPPFGRSDHLALVTELGVSLANDKEESAKIEYKTAWSKVMLKDLCNFSKENIDWNYSKINMGVEEMWDELHGKLNQVTSIVPQFPVLGDGRPVRVPWSSSSLKRMRKSKEKAWKLFDSSI